MFQFEDQSIKQVVKSFMSTAALLVLLQGVLSPSLSTEGPNEKPGFYFSKVFFYSLSITPSKVITLILKTNI